MEIKKDLDSIISYLMALDQNEPNTELCKRIDSLIDISQAINYTRCSTQLPTEDEILSEANSRQLEGTEPYSFAGGARWALSNVKQIPKTQKED